MRGGVAAESGARGLQPELFPHEERQEGRLHLQGAAVRGSGEGQEGREREPESGGEAKKNEPGPNGRHPGGEAASGERNLAAGVRRPAAGRAGGLRRRRRAAGNHPAVRRRRRKD